MAVLAIPLPLPFPPKRRSNRKMRVLCLNGYEGVLSEGEVYTVSEVTHKGNYLLEEVEPPQPYSSFRKERFVPLTDSPETEVVEEILMGADES